jgi:hypothetical protein
MRPLTTVPHKLASSWISPWTPASRSAAVAWSCGNLKTSGMVTWPFVSAPDALGAELDDDELDSGVTPTHAVSGSRNRTTNTFTSTLPKSRRRTLYSAVARASNSVIVGQYKVLASSLN